MIPRARIALEIIGVVRSPFEEKRDAPRQASVARDVEGFIELSPSAEIEHALEDLASFSHLWVIYLFHEAEGFRPKVMPPRGDGGRVGVFATRSPHRPNPIGLSAVRLVRVEGFRVHIRGVDMIDGTPVLDLKPYLAYADAIPDASAGWLAADPKRDWRVEFRVRADEQLAFLGALGAELRRDLVGALSLGPEPKPYRRIRREGDRSRIAVKDWRAWFTVEDRTIFVERLGSGHRQIDRRSPENAAHLAFEERFGDD